MSLLRAVLRFGDPELIGRLDLEVAIHKGGGRSGFLIASRRGGAALAVTSPHKAGDAYQPSDALASVSLAPGGARQGP